MGCKANGYNYKKEQDDIAKKLLFKDSVDAMHGLYNEGLSYSMIGELFGVTSACIATRAKKLGIKPRSRGGANGKKIILTQAQLNELLELKETREVLAERFDISQPTISRIRNGKIQPIIINDAPL